MLLYRRNRKDFLLILFFTLFKLVLHLAANSHFGFHRDELLYLALGEHPDWGYQEVPPFIAGISWLSVHLFGDSVFAGRLFSTLAGTLIVFFTGLSVLALRGNRLAISIACIGIILSPAFLASGYLLQPVVFDQLFWILSAYLLIRYVQNHQKKYAYALGVVVGLGMLCKYTMAFFILALLIGLLITPQRKILFQRVWFIAAAIAFILFMPNLLWQIKQGLPVIKHMNELKATQLNYINPVDFLLQQLLVHASATIIWIGGFIYIFSSRTFKPYHFLGYSFIVVLVLLILLKGKVYYSFGAYPMLFAIGGIAFSRLLGNLSVFIKYSAAALIITPALIFVPVAIPILPFQSTLQFFEFTSKRMNVRFPLKWEDQKYHATTQDYADMLGWEEIARHVNTAYRLIPETEHSQTTIFANNYGQAGAVDRFRAKYNLPAVVCLNSSYALWSPETIPYRHLIYINDEYPNDLVPLYKHIVKIAEVTDLYAREKGTRVYLLSDPKKDLNPLYQEHRLQALK